MPKVNWNDANQQSSLVPDGKYLCKVKNVIEKITKTGKEMWTIYLSIEEDGEYYGSILFHNLVFGPASLWVVKRFYEAAWGEILDGEHECNTSDLIGAHVFAHVKGKKEYEGKEQPILVYFESPKGTNKASDEKSKSSNDDDIPF